jgi:protein-S-isoprenylcysteine O-methyltransferase Ste14
MSCAAEEAAKASRPSAPAAARATPCWWKYERRKELPMVLRLMRRGIIEREERYLERKFGDEYIEYKVRTPRWI